MACNNIPAYYPAKSGSRYDWSMEIEIENELIFIVGNQVSKLLFKPDKLHSSTDSPYPIKQVYIRTRIGVAKPMKGISLADWICANHYCQ